MPQARAEPRQGGQSPAQGAPDRAAAEAIIEVSPVVFACVRANRAFLHRAVRYLALEAGISTSASPSPSWCCAPCSTSAVFTPRTGAGYARFFDGLSLVGPGLVPMPQWRPEPVADAAELIPMYAAVGRKP
jgi:hypothetical protein